MSSSSSRIRWALTVASMLALLIVPSASAQARGGANPLGPVLDVSEVPVGIDSLQLAAEGWTEEVPGLWTQQLADGSQRMQAQGEVALREVARRLRDRAQSSLSGDLTKSQNSARFAATLSLISELEQRKPQPKQLTDPCFRSKSVYAGASPSTTTCGTNAFAVATVSSNSYCHTSCTVRALTWALGSCSQNISATGNTNECYKQGTTEACTSSAQQQRPYNCEAGAWASVYCPSEGYIYIYAYDPVYTCGSGPACVC